MASRLSAEEEQVRNTITIHLTLNLCSSGSVAKQPGDTVQWVFKLGSGDHQGPKGSARGCAEV